jgi:hypothetical protein
MGCATILTFLEHNAHLNIILYSFLHPPPPPPPPSHPENKTHIHYQISHLILWEVTMYSDNQTNPIKKVVKCQDISIMSKESPAFMNMQFDSYCIFIHLLFIKQ